MSSSIIPNTTSPNSSPEYASFWLRFWALVIDQAILIIVIVVFSILFGILSGVGRIVAWPFSFFSFEWQGGYDQFAFFKLMVVCWMYFALMESSSWQATLGKRALGLCVTNENGGRVTFGRASIRFFAKGLSTFICFLGYIMAAFTSKHQALHDMIAETVVVKR